MRAAALIAALAGLGYLWWSRPKRSPFAAPTGASDRAIDALGLSAWTDPLPPTHGDGGIFTPPHTDDAPFGAPYTVRSFRERDYAVWKSSAL